jgi:hypothetical protein
MPGLQQAGHRRFHGDHFCFNSLHRKKLQKFTTAQIEILLFINL